MSEYLFSEELDDVIFRRGTVICIKHYLMFEPALSVIQKRDGKNLYFRIPDQFLKSNVLKGDSLTCQIICDDMEFVISGMITDIDIHYPRLVELNVDKVQKFKNKRNAKRYFVNFQSLIHVPSTDKPIYAVIKNVSESGIAAVFKEHISTDILVNVSVSASVSKNEFLQFKAMVIRAIPKSNFNEYGLEITEIDDTNKDLLDKLIFRLQEHESEFVAEYLK